MWGVVIHQTRLPAVGHCVLGLISVAISKILLYYKFTPIADPTAVMLWQRALCESLGLTGRILISKHGINGTVGGDIAACKRYARVTKEYPGFKGMEFKWSEGGADDFPRLSVKVRDEIVAFGAADELEVDAHGVVGGGVHLTPEEVNKLVEERGDDVVFFDGRNAMEAEIGRFRGAIVPDVNTTHDFIQEIESGKYDDLKDKPVITYCTGGIRCEILSALMKNRGFNAMAVSSVTAKNTATRAYGKGHSTFSTVACTWNLAPTRKNLGTVFTVEPPVTNSSTVAMRTAGNSDSCVPTAMTTPKLATVATPSV